VKSKPKHDVEEERSPREHDDPNGASETHPNNNTNGKQYELATFALG